jgi:hypothetical protein
MRVLSLLRIAFACFIFSPFGAAAPAQTKAAPQQSSETRTPFSIQRRQGIDWLVRPGGKRFFSFGVCVVNSGIARDDYLPSNPGYASWQHYPDTNSWAVATVRRLKSWGFTTIGGWSDFEALKRSGDSNLVFTPVLHVGSTAGAPWWDMWDPKIIERMHQIAREQILPLRDDPRVLGYYSDNEMGWWNAILFKMTLEHASTSGQRQRTLELLRQTYHNDWSELLKDFDPEGAASFEQLEQRGLLYLRPGGNGAHTLRRFLGMLAERYYSLVREIILQYHPKALVLGDRYQSFYYPEVARASKRYVDIASGNLNASWNDGTFARFYLETLHALTGKPVLVSEFYLCASENRSANQNDKGVFPVVASQQQRVDGFRNTLHALLNIPYVVGADWFQYYDEPTHGRGDGENFNFGLVDIHDRPYELLIAASADSDLNAAKSRASFTRPDASGGVPPAPPNPLGDFQPTLALRSWDRERGFIPPVSEFPVADLYLCWSPKAIYLGLYAQDIVEEAAYRDKAVPPEARAEWVVSLPKPGKTIRARIGAGAQPIVDESSVQITNLAGVYLNTRTVAAMEFPAKLFGKERFKAGDALEIGSTFFGHGRTEHTEWKGKFKLRN